MSDDHTTTSTPGWTPSLSGAQPEAGPLRPCVVLAALDSPIPDALHHALQAADLAPRIEHDPRLAMAEACLLRRETRERAALGLEDALTPPLILLSPPEGAAGEMVDTLQRIVPDIPVLMLVGEALGELDAGGPEPTADLVPDEIESLLGRPADQAHQGQA
ncbi:MAG: hypothetical protein MK074_04580 [Phycisphaerales bacterium]|nr:hypothetical protein [Phycisphaerales bacterium]